MVRWNGVLVPAPVIRRPTRWDQFNEDLEHGWLVLLAPMLGFGGMMGVLAKAFAPEYVQLLT